MTFLSNQQTKKNGSRDKTWLPFSTKMEPLNLNRLVEALRKLQVETLTLEQVKVIADTALNDTVEGRLIGSTTNSPIGCQHWFNTLLSKVNHIGEFMQEEELTDEERHKWGLSLCDIAKTLTDNYNKIPFNY